MKRLLLTLLLFLFVTGNILLLASPCVKSGVKVSPAKLVITIEDYPEKEINYKVKVTNPYSYDIRVSSRVIHPYDLTENYMRIPDLSWVKFLPETLDVPAKSYKEFEVLIDVPENEKTLHYNESWEVWVFVIPKILSGASGGTAIRVQLGVKLFIHTPTGTMGMQKPQSLYLLVGIILGLVVVTTVFFIIKKKEAVKADRKAIFYCRNKENSKFKNNKF